MEPYRLYSRLADHETVLECWGASTKHPDSVFHFSDWTDRAPWLNEEALIFQWLLYCASKLSFVFSSYTLAYWAMELMGLVEEEV